MNSFSSRRRQRHHLNADINVVPYIDVMLVLLVIFMITAPLLSQGIKVNLPKTSSQSLPSMKKPLILSVNQQGQYFLNLSKTPRTPLSIQALMSDVDSLLSKQPSSISGIYVKGDKSVNYGKVIQAMATLQKAGATHVGLITQNPY